MINSFKKAKDTIRLIPSILKLIKRICEEKGDNIFMNKIDFIKHIYNIFIKFIFDMLDLTQISKNEENSIFPLGHQKLIINNVFCKDNYIANFYLIFIYILKDEKDILKNNYVINNQIQQISNLDKDKIKKLENMMKQLEIDMKQIIDKTLYNYVDIFYFKLLFSMYINNKNNNEIYDFIFRIMEYIINKLDEYEENHPFSLKNENEEDKSYIKVGLSNKNLLSLIYQIVFYEPRKNVFIENEIFNKEILLYLTSFLHKKKLIYLKIFFPIEGNIANKKLIIEMLFEIFINLYQYYREINNPQFSIFETLINELLEGGRGDPLKKTKKKNINKIPKTICYDIDELNLRKKYNEFSKEFFLYLKDINPSEQSISVTMLFLIKITIYLVNLEKKEIKSNLIDFFNEMMELLCQNAKKLSQNYENYKPLFCSNSNSTILYDEFVNYILNEYDITSVFNKTDLTKKINLNSKLYKVYINIDFSEVDKTAQLNKAIKLISNDKKNPKIYTNLDNKNNKNIFPKSNNSSIKEDINKKVTYYKIIPKFFKYFLRTHFSIYFINLLTYDEDFIKLKKIYNYLYNTQIDDINKYFLNYPSKLKNRLGNIYTKNFLKKDFNFFSSQYFKYSHKYIHGKNFEPINEILFPSKKILEKYDFAHKEINDELKNKKKIITERNCELITIDGTIFGNIFIFDNCILFMSDIKNDQRKIKHKLDYVCCSIEFYFLEKEKIKIIEFSDIKNVIPRKFIHSWISLEIFMKNGKSYLFNFFNEFTNELILDIIKGKKVKVIKNVKEYFDKKNYIKKWKEGKISTYDYLLKLNKFSSRTYNDLNQYPIMPWTFMADKRLRNFDLPMSLQNEESKERFLELPYDNEEQQNRYHNYHYSLSEYIYYYLMRVKPFTEILLKYEDSNFDLPERQFYDIRQTLLLCENYEANREPIPELYTIPEVYLNLNCNDFGEDEVNNNGRIHNVKFSTYVENAYEFIYDFKFRLNNDEKINNNINMWFNFIFGINQYNKDNINGKGFLNFNKYCYSQNVNIKKMKEDLRKINKTEIEIYNEIKGKIRFSTIYGKCPFQILSYPHPKKAYINEINNIYMNEQDLIKLDKNKKGNEGNEFKYFDIQDEIERKYIIYFHKSIYKNSIYCFFNNKDIEIYQKSSWYKDYKFVKKINISKNYLFSKKNVNGYPILNPEFLFCELKEENFIFCRYLDNSIKLSTPNGETNFLVDSFITSVIRINENEFITGDNKGKLCQWKINFNELNINLQLVKKVKSNKNSITAILYNKKLNIIISSDNNSVVIRSFYDFEFLTYIYINDIEIEETIIDVKCSINDFIYILINKGNNYKEIKGYSLNGICFGENKDRISNFQLTKNGKILVGLTDKGIIASLHPITFKYIHCKFINVTETKSYLYHFYFEEPNKIFLGINNIEEDKVKIIELINDEVKAFI